MVQVEVEMEMEGSSGKILGFEFGDFLRGTF